MIGSDPLGRCVGVEHSAQELLCEALGVSSESVTRVSRDPLGDGAVVGFDVMPRDAPPPDPSRLGPGMQPLRYYVDTSRLVVRRETGLALDGSIAPEARIWLHPADPHLPALPSVAFHHAAGSLLARFGIVDRVVPEFVTYRAGRRAVLRVSAGARTLWVKVVRPSRISRIVRAHEACALAGIPVPRTEGWSPEGVILLASAEGVPAVEAAWGPEDLLDSVDGLRERIASVATRAPSRGVAGRLEWYASRMQDSDRAARVSRRARCILEGNLCARRPRVVHGDLHLGQLFLGAGGGLSAVVDVDTLGVGDAAEDPAAFLAHATASALLTPPGYRARVWALADGAMRRWGGDRVVLALFAAHMLGHALAASDGGDGATADRLLTAAESVLAGGVPSAAEHPSHEKALIGCLDRP